MAGQSHEFVNLDESRPTIARRSRKCLDSFETLSFRHAAVNSILSDGRRNITDEMGRFKVWAGNIGALQEGTSSLDDRLMSAPNVSEKIGSVLHDLAGSLEERKS